jgi:TolB-like protein/Tfp pilus assembly protein PilF
MFKTFITLSQLTVIMASLIPGYEYDIFISYRQKDNKGDRWVSEFVEALKTELESTFKEEINVYFDINPQDGLLETHDVDESLKDKLKCLIFIPIISRTYCDPKSFAWEHEFKAFVEQASQDQFGLKVKLPNGNVASRILPIQIHDLTAEDKALFEKELGGVLRAIEFIYKEPGVNKPLTSEDDEKKNLNNTKYRIQINKVANAIDEIVRSLKSIQTAPLKDKTRQSNPFDEFKKENERKELINKVIFNQKSKKWMIVLLSAFLCVVGAYAIYQIIYRSKQTQDLTKLEKSIAVLPFVNDSPDEENAYFINGIMDEILNNLQKIKDFRVLSRTSTEQFRGSAKLTIPKIAKELDVNYIVEGSGQKYGNTFRLRVQLIAANNEKHLWAESYEQEIRDTKDIFKIQSQVAQAIASELKATITPEEKQLIEKTSTTNLTAYDFYQRGGEELRKYGNLNRQSLKRAEEMYNKALEYDSTFARAYIGLADVYYTKHFYESYYSENFLDSVLVLADLALSYDDHLADAYYTRAKYYLQIGKTEQAIKAYDKALKYNPNYWEVYNNKGHYVYFMDYNNMDFVKGLEYLHKAVSINHGKELPDLLRGLGLAYGWEAGFLQKGNYYFQEAFKLDGDTNAYFMDLAMLEQVSRNYEKAIELFNKCYVRDSNSVEITGWLAYDYYMLDQSKESLKYVKKFEEKLEGADWLFYSAMKRIGYVYWQNGYKKEADQWFNKQKKISEESIKMGRYYSIDAYYDLAAVSAFKGEKGKAYENLRKVSKIHACPLWLLASIKDDPLFNSIRNEPEFQKIVSDLEAKYQEEHERVKKWLEENNML